KVLFALSRRPSLGLVRDRLANAARVRDIKTALAEGLGVEEGAIRAKFHKVEHHRAHMASAFLVSPFEVSACLSVDGFGDFVSAMWGRGRGNRVESDGYVAFPHSLGILYTAVTQYIGFPKYGDEYKVMGLAPFGKPTYLEEFREIVHGGPEGYDLDLDWFVHHSDGVPMVWDGGEPTLGRVFSQKFVERFGTVRGKGEPLEKRHEDLAASVQAVCEEVIFGLLRGLHARTKETRLCLAGGVGFNSVANGKILGETPFTDLFIQPAAGDAGTALGAAFYVWNHVLGNPRGFVMEHAYWGPAFDDAAVEAAAASHADPFRQSGVSARRFEDEEDLCHETARDLAAGKVVGWFQGRMEWGPRALGNRSILADPRRTDMRDRINEIIKKRENFRPFCPSILEEAVPEYFERDYPEPFMIKVYPVRKEKHGVIPAVTHVDG
ncbi:MAG: carbamoyltransferase, partial [Planctomycetes bacterium]|nr:carbamoyltransferase [Planctomycetota bacterium]